MKREYKIVVYKHKKKLCDIEADFVQVNQKRDVKKVCDENGFVVDLITDGCVWGDVLFVRR